MKLLSADYYERTQRKPTTQEELKRSINLLKI